MSEAFETIQRSGSVLYGTCGGVWAMILHARPTAADMLLAKPALQSMANRFPTGFPTLTWVLPSAGFSMDSDARVAATDVTKGFIKVIRAEATLIEATGFQGAAVRAIVAGMDAILPASAPKKVFSALPPAIDWCASLRPAGGRNLVTAKDITASIAAARSLL